MNCPRVAIIILNWNGYQETCDCVESILRITYKNYKIIIVDNGSKNNEAEKLEAKFKDKITVIKNNENLGYCGGNNEGIGYAKEQNFDFALILNNDTVVDPEFLSSMVRFMSQNQLGAVGVSLLDYSDRKRIQNQGMNFNSWTSTILAVNCNKVFSQKLVSRARFFSGACFLIDLRLIDDMLFDDHLFCYFEEIDLALRLKRKGVKIAIDNKAIVYHKGSVAADSIKGFSEFQMARNRFIVIKNNCFLLQKIIFISFILFFYWYFHILVLCKNRKVRNVPYFIKGLAAGFKEFYG